MIIVPGGAPPWVADVCRAADREILEAKLGMFYSTSTYDASVPSELPDPTKANGKIIFLENGTFWLARAVAGAWVYPDNTPV